MRKDIKTINLPMPPDGNNPSNPLGLPSGQFTPVSKVFCQESLPKSVKLLYNNIILTFIIMAGLKMTALAAGFGAALAGTPETADAQATEIMLPHPEQELVVDVSRVALETQEQIMTALIDCIREGQEFADANGDGEIKGPVEMGDFEWAQAECSESAKRQFSIADSVAKVADARARIHAVGDAIIEDLQNGS